MIRKTLIALAAAGTLALGMISVSSPASANIVIRFGSGYHHGWHNGWHHGYGPHCFWRNVRVRHHHHWVWRKIRVCPGYYGGY
jgi:hypothetical protein